MKSQPALLLAPLLLSALLPPPTLPAATEIRSLVAADGAADDYFGISVALSGTTALVGAGRDDVGSNTNQGSAYLFDATTGTQTRKLTASDGAAGDNFGGNGFSISSASLSGTTALVGASSKNSFQGAAYLFDATTGTQTRKLTASDGAAGDNFGNSVALSGTTALIGANNDDVGANFSQGSAYLFNTTTGAQTFKLTANDGAAGDFFGNSVALSGTTALVGTLNGSGIYLFDTATGAQTFKLVAPSNPSGDSGSSRQEVYSLALSGTTALVGMLFDDIGANVDQGSVYAFDTTTGAFLYQLTASDGAADDYFGSSMATDGSLAVIGASSFSNPGALYVFDLATRQQVQKLTASDGGPIGAAALSGGLILGGAYSQNSDQGKAYVFDAVPEPGALPLLALGLALSPLLRRRRIS